MYVDVVISNVFNLNKYFFILFFYFFIFFICQQAAGHVTVWIVGDFTQGLLSCTSPARTPLHHFKVNDFIILHVFQAALW